MSYDVYFEIDTGSGVDVEVGWRNYTSNVSGMWDKALALPPSIETYDDGHPRNWGLGLLHDAPASEAAGVLSAAVERMAASPDEYRPMEPGNGWGDYEGALDFLRWIAEMAREHPATTIRISR